MKAVRDRIGRVLLYTLVFTAAFGWWGFLYPELTMTKDTYRIVSEDGTVQESGDVVEWEPDGGVYVEILSADRSQVRFRSGLVQSVRELMRIWSGNEE